MRVISRVFNLNRFLFRVPINNVNSTLVPNTHAISTFRNFTYLSHVLALKNGISARNELSVFKSSEKHSIATAKSELIWSLSLNDFVNIAS